MRPSRSPVSGRLTANLSGARGFALPRQVWFGLFGVLLLAALAWAVLKSGPLAPIKVTVVQAARGDLSPGLFGIGTVAAQRAYVVGPTVAGRVKRVLVDVGDAVRAGQLLAEMEPVDLDARVTAADAAMSRADGAVATSAAQLRDAVSRQQLAASEVRRYVDLGNKGFVSASVIDSKRQQQASADAQVAAAEASLASARQDVARLDAERAGARQQRGNVRLLAPVDGMVTARDAEPGSTVVAGQAVLKLVDPASLRVRTRVDQGRSVGLRAGLPAQVVLRARPDESLPGKLSRVDPLSDSVTEERVADVVFDVLPPGLSIGDMAEVTLQLPTLNDVLLVPNAALRQRAGRTGVWLRADGRLRFVAAKAGARSLDGRVQILDGLKAGEEVVLHSERDLDDGSRIAVVDALPAATAKAAGGM